VRPPVIMWWGHLSSCGEATCHHVVRPPVIMW